MAENKEIVKISEEIGQDAVLIKPSKGWSGLNLKDLWRFRGLAYFLTWRDIKVRYKQTVLGAGWAVIQPLMQMVVFTFLFNRIGNISTGEVPPELFAFAALLPWNLFSKALQDASKSLVSNKSMITKVYFPRMLIPFSSILSGLVDFAIAFVVLIGMMIYFKFPITITALYIPLYLILVLTAALGVGLWLSAWNLHYRDVGYFLPFLTQVWMLITPVAFPLSEITDKYLSSIPQQFHFIYYLNPMVGVIEGIRAALLGTAPPSGEVLGISAAVSAFLLVSGLFYFRRMERTFADMV
jgi:lipopolysaccharide transport system permease protein